MRTKHSNNSKLPSIGDIKDGLLKMILYCNLTNVKIGDKNFVAVPTLKLTSSKLISSFKFSNSEQQKQDFFNQNQFNKKQKEIIDYLLLESKTNNIEIIISSV